MKYMFDVPDNWDLKHCRINIGRNGEVKIEKPVDHCIYSVAESKLVSINDDPYYGTLHKRVADCVSKLREHFSLGYIVDSCGGIQALETTTNELMKY